MNIDKINLPATGWIGLGLVVATALTQPPVQQALVTTFTHPSAENIIALLGLAAGGLLLWIGKPPLTSPAPPKVGS